METYLQTAWGDQWDDVTIDIVKQAIELVKKQDDENGVFWVGIFDGDESILEVNKNMELMGMFEDEPDNEYRGSGKSWNEVVDLYKAFLDNQFEIVKAKLST